MTRVRIIAAETTQSLVQIDYSHGFCEPQGGMSYTPKWWSRSSRRSIDGGSPKLPERQNDQPPHETWANIMAIRSFWRMWTEAKSEEKALRGFELVRGKLGREALDQSVEPYPKITGFVVAFWIELESQAWNDSVIEVIALGQRVGYQWTLSGDILTDTEGWSNEPTVSGVRSIQWMLNRRGTITKIVDA